MIGYRQEKVLKEYYEKNSHPKKYELEQLSQFLALDSREIENWFQKSRLQNHHQSKKHPEQQHTIQKILDQKTNINETMQNVNKQLTSIKQLEIRYNSRIVESNRPLQVVEIVNKQLTSASKSTIQQLENRYNSSRVVESQSLNNQPALQVVETVNKQLTISKSQHLETLQVMETVNKQLTHPNAIQETKRQRTSKKCESQSTDNQSAMQSMKNVNKQLIQPLEIVEIVNKQLTHPNAIQQTKRQRTSRKYDSQSTNNQSAMQICMEKVNKQLMQSSSIKQTGQLLNHLFHSPLFQFVICKICGQSFSDVHTRKRHMKTTHSREMDANVNKQLKSLECKQKLSNGSTNQNSKEQPKHQCIYCNDQIPGGNYESHLENCFINSTSKNYSENENRTVEFEGDDNCTIIQDNQALKSTISNKKKSSVKDIFENGIQDELIKDKNSIPECKFCDDLFGGNFSKDSYRFDGCYLP